MYGGEAEGFTVRASGGRGSVVIRSGGYLVLGASQDPHDNGGARVDVAFDPGQFRLDDTRDTIELRFDGTRVDAVSYAPPFPLEEGRAMALSAAAMDAELNDEAAHWCASPVPMRGEGEQADRGTPGAPNPRCRAR